MSDAQFCPIGKLEKIFLATDGSIHSEGAIREAISFAKKCSSRLYACMTLVTNPEYETVGSSAFQEEEKTATAHLESIKATAAKEGLECETFFHQSIKATVDEAAKKKVDMIVIGRHGRKGLLKALMGEDAAKVIAHAPCKVLVVPKAAKIEYRNISVAVDGSAHSDAAVTEAIAIAKKCGSHLIVLFAMSDEREREEATLHTNKAVAQAQKEGVSAEAVTPIGKPFDAIVETAGGRGVDLIIMGTYGKTGIKKLLMGSSTEKVIGNAGCAVLVVKA